MKNLRYYPSYKAHHFSYEHVHIKSSQQVLLHQQETWELAYIVTGSGIRQIGDVEEQFFSGEVILIPPNIPHCWTFDENVCDKEGKIENICIFFKNEFLETCKNNFPQLKDIVDKIQKNTNAISFNDSGLKKIQYLLQKMSRQNDVEKLASFIMILEAISDLDKIRIVGKPLKNLDEEKRLKDIHFFILNNFHRPITLKEISAIAGLTVSGFCTFFKKNYGKSFIAYLTEFRLETSCQMLVKTSKTIAEISIASGFNDVPYFNRTFKKNIGLTPKEFRKKNLE